MCRSFRSPGHHRKRKIFSQIKRLSYGRKRTTTENVKPYVYYAYVRQYRNWKWSWNTQSNNRDGGTWFTHGEGSMGGGGGVLPIARDWKWGGWRGSCLSIKVFGFSWNVLLHCSWVNWHIVITCTIYSLEIPIPSDCGLRACWEFFGTQNKSVKIVFMGETIHLSPVQIRVLLFAEGSS